MDNISLEVNPGEIYGLLGPNGAGKTTSLRLMATLLKPDKGHITISGYNSVTQPKKARRTLGFLTSDMKLSGNLSPLSLLWFMGQLNQLDKGKISKRITDLSRYLAMENFIELPVEKLSTGMKQKAAIAVSLIHDPDVILFDEPTNGLDIYATKYVTDFIEDSKRKKKTILISTHHMAEADKLCDRLGIIMDGKMVVQGTKEFLLNRYQTENLEDIFFLHPLKKRG